MTLRTNTRDAGRRAFLSITRGTLVKTDDTKKMQELEVRGLYGERIKGVEHWQPYGFAYHAKVPQEGQGEAEALIANVGGNASHPVVLAVADRRHRRPTLQEGESALYDDQGQKVHITRDGIKLDGGTLKKPQTITVGNATLTVADGKITANVGGMIMTITPTKISLGADNATAAVQTTAGPSSKVFAAV
jgi:phage baseplate assembly protein V